MEQKAARGRPRAFDTEVAVEALQAVFWKHGLEATALADLTAATGLHKPSLYAAFGQKLAIYLVALDAYLNVSGKLVERALALPTLRGALNAFFDADLDLFLAEQGRGCFLLSTAVPVVGTHPEIAKRVAAAQAGLAAALAARIANAQSENELLIDAPVEVLADIVVSTHIALALRARSGEGRAALAATADRIVSLVCS